MYNYGRKIDKHKIHKPGKPFRIIIHSVIQPIAQLSEKELNVYVVNVETYIKYTPYLIQNSQKLEEKTPELRIRFYFVGTVSVCRGKREEMRGE